MAKAENLTPKQERFAQVYVETSNASEAYRQAYDVSPDTLPKTVWEEASVTLANPKVAARVMELQEAAREAHAVTVQSIADELAEDRQLAHTAGQAGAAVSASMGKAKLYGLITDKSETKLGATDEFAAFLSGIAGNGKRIGED